MDGIKDNTSILFNGLRRNAVNITYAIAAVEEPRPTVLQHLILIKHSRHVLGQLSQRILMGMLLEKGCHPLCQPHDKQAIQIRERFGPRRYRGKIKGAEELAIKLYGRRNIALETHLGIA